MGANIADAVSAYSKVAKSGLNAGTEAREGQGGGFAEMLLDATADAVDTMKKGEEMSIKAAAGDADLNQVVVAVSKAELTLQTVTAIRDRAVQAYQDILRMPI